MKPFPPVPPFLVLGISVPSTRVYAMKPRYTRSRVFRQTNFSTLDSGLRDETW